jgi:maleylacetate reductase
MIVRWGLESLGGVLRAVGIVRPLLVSTERWRNLQLPVASRFHGVLPHAERRGVEGALEQARATGADGLVGLGGGSAIDSAKAVSAENALALVSVPTTYAGAEWTAYFGVRDAGNGTKGGGGGARLAAIVYDPQLTLDLPRAESAGTAMNALAHCAEALYVRNRNDESDRHALAGARLIGTALPAVLADGSEVDPRTRLLEGACEAGAALAGSGLALGHAMAQALGGRYGLPHGALNAICLSPALRFNEPVVPEAIALLGEALGTDDPIERVEELARLGGFNRLRELEVPHEELDEVAEATAQRPAMRLNPRPATPAEIAELLESVW